MKISGKALGLGVAATILVAGCDIEKEQDGELPNVDMSYQEGELPEYEVTKTQEGRLPDVDVNVEGGQLPKYDIDTADVNIGTKEVEVSVPDVDVEMEKKTMTVPDVDIEMPEEEPPE